MGSALNILAAALMTFVPLLRPCDCGDFTLFCHCAIPAPSVPDQAVGTHESDAGPGCCGLAGCTKTPDKPKHPRPCPKDRNCSQAIAFSAEPAKDVATESLPACPATGPAPDVRGVAPSVVQARPDATATPPPTHRAFLRLCRILI